MTITIPPKTALEQWRERQAKKKQNEQVCSTCGRVLLRIAQNPQGESYGTPELNFITFGQNENGGLSLRGRCKQCNQIQEINNPVDLLAKAA